MKKRKKLVYKPKAHWKETMGFDKIFIIFA